MGERMNNFPVIGEMIEEKNLIKHTVYQAKQNYKLIFVNKKLYEKIFNEQYNESSKQKLEEMFSITLEEKMSNGEVIGEGFADLQKDDSGISLSGNLGSGRAFFYGKNFNIKGERTSLATSKDIYYSDGKMCLPAALKESVFANIIAKDFDPSCFQTLAVFDKNRSYIYRQQFLNENDEVVDEYFKLKEAIEVRYYDKEQFFRISNKIANEKPFEESEIKLLCENIGKMEAYKFIARFLHGSWSAGNLTTNGNMLDFDTACFVEGRNPQFSNTNKYKASYFGYEILGQKMLIKNIIDYDLKLGVDISYDKSEQLIDISYKENVMKYFCDILGLDYKAHYSKNKELIDEMFYHFNILSRQFLPNYYELNVNAKYVNNTYIYNFSRFFQKFLLKMNKNDYILQALSLLLAPTKSIEYEKVGKIKDIIQENFADILIEDDENLAFKTFKEITDFANLTIKLYSNFNVEEIEKIKLKSYVVNFDRHYLYNNNFLFDKINNLYERGSLSANDVDKIINATIELNRRNFDFSNEKNFKLGLKICNECLYYFEFSSEGYKIIFQPFDCLNVKFAKVYVDGKDFYLSHNNGRMESEFILTNNFEDIDEKIVKFKINGSWHDFEDIINVE